MTKRSGTAPSEVKTPADKPTTDRILVRYEFDVVLHGKITGISARVESDFSQVLRIIGHGLEQSGVRFLDVTNGKFELKAVFESDIKKPKRSGRKK